MRVGVLDEVDAAQVLLDLAPAAGDRAEAAALATRLGRLPLALHLAGTYLSAGLAGLPTFVRYRAALDERGGVKLLTPDPDTPEASDQRAIVTRTWELSLDELARHGVPQARPVLRLLSCFAPATPIPVDLLDGDGMSQLVSDTPVDQVLRALVRVGLVDGLPGSEQPAIVVHPVIADANRAHLSEAGGAGLIQPTAVALVQRAISTMRWSEPRNWPRVRLLTPHLHALLVSVAPQLDHANLAALIDTVWNAAGILDWSGERSAAMRLLTDARAGASPLSREHPAVLRARGFLAWLIGDEGRWEEAEHLLRDVLDGKRRVLGEDHPDTLSTRHHIGLALAGLRRWAEAEMAFRDLLLAYRRVLGDDDPETLSARLDLARAIGEQGRWAEAETAYRELLDARLRVEHKEHPAVLAIHHELARAIAHRGRWEEADASFRRLIEVRKRVLGDDHPDTLRSRHDLASTIANQGRWPAAEPIFRDVLEARVRVLGPEHPDTVFTQELLRQQSTMSLPPAGSQQVRRIGTSGPDHQRDSLERDGSGTHSLY